MGNQLSRRFNGSSSDSPAATTTTSAPAVDPNIQYMAELTSYELACQLDPDLQIFDSTLQARTNRVIASLAGGGVEVRSLSLDSLKEVTGCLLEMNQEVVKIILDCKKDIWNNQSLFDLVEDYFESTLQTLDFCTALEKCLKRARDSQLIVHVALQHFDDEEEKNYSSTLDELRHFKAVGDPFTEEFFGAFKSVYGHQLSMLRKLKHRKGKLDKRIRKVEVWRKVTSIIFASAFAAVLICSVVAAAMAAPPVVAALAAAASIPLGSMGKWFNSLWKDYEVAMRGQRDVMHSMQVGTYVVIKDLDGIRVLVDRLEVQIGGLLQNAEFALGDEDAVRFGVEEIRKKLGEFMKSVEDLGEHTDKCSRDIRRARTVVLQRIIRHPS
ncbi:UPF0496 protein 1 [Acorus gramineus]|uniref:UPF0496 protein 1 n=1 Tax=Acorus gramineus TaxID=55184 RepID=A0AAV9BKT4_ACOGR|nr:UPF0496 protein 1 [Acorus gramineus]